MAHDAARGNRRAPRRSTGSGPRAVDPTWPSRDESLAFIADYEAARARAFTAAERRRIAAGMTYAIAYTARCEGGNPGEMCAALAAIA